MEAPPAPAGRGTTQELREVLLVATVFLLAIERDLTIWSEPGGANDHHLRVGISAFHLPLITLVTLALLDAVRTQPVPKITTTRLVAATAGWFVVAFAISPSWRGLDLLVHVLALWAIWDTFRAADDEGRARLVLAVAMFGAAQALLGIVQGINDAPLGISLLEAPGGLEKIDGAFAVRGSLTHPYHYVGLILVCSAAAFVFAMANATSRRFRWPIMAALVLMGAAIPMTLSRTAILSVVPMGLLLIRRSGMLRPVCAWLSGMGIGLLLSVDGIVGRSTATIDAVSTDSGRSVDTGRIDRLRESIDVMRLEPITGVGPGNYVSRLRELKDAAVGDEVLPSHNVLFHAAAEVGLFGAMLVLACLVAGVLWAVKGGALRMMVVSSLAPFFLLDLYPYTLQLGIVMSGLWIGLAQISGDSPRVPATSHSDRWPEVLQAPEGPGR